MMSRLVAGLLVAVAVLGPGTSRGALIEIPTPRSLSGHALDVQSVAASLLPAVVERFDNRIPPASFPKVSRDPGGLGPDGKAMRIAGNTYLPGNVAAAAIGFDFIAKADLAGLAPPAGQDALQPPKVWTLLLLGAGLVAFHLRRQARKSSRFIKVSP